MEVIEKKDFDLIWDRLPELQNRHSSLWWFFLLFPRQERGFGPKQMMFVIVSKAGEWLGINHKWFSGLRPPLNGNSRQPDKTAPDEFNATVLGWIYDGRQMHEGLVHQVAKATLSPEGSLTAWSEVENGRRYGGEMRSGGTRPYGITAEFAGQKGSASFEVWGDPASEVMTPANTLTLETPLGGTDVLAWRHMQFEGEFASPGGREHLAGIGYFQRICLNINPFPWKWIWSAFEDGSVFSAFIPYLGPHLLRRGDWFFPNIVEKATVPIKGGAYFFWPDTHDLVQFDRRRITPLLSDKPYPDFLIECRSSAGDYLTYRAVSYSHAQVLLDERILKVVPMRYNYNEYMFQIEDLAGQVGGRPVNKKTVGQGFGNIEYTWGLGA
jgi:hypothetical protein